MTETLLDPPPVPPSPPRRLARDPEERYVAGVCGGLARYTDTDPVLWRVAAGVLTVFGGAGLALYGLGWLLLPRADEPQSIAERTLRRPGRGVTAAGVVVLVLLVCLVLGVLDVAGEGLGVALVLGGLAYLVLRERRPAAGVTGPPAPPASYGPATWSDGGPPPAPAPVVRRPRSRLGGLVVSTACLVVGVLVALRLAGVDGLTAPRVVAAALLVVGGGLLVGAWWGRARWLALVGLLLALGLAVTAAASGARVDGSVGERSWVVTGDGSYALGAGEAVLDLRGLRPGQRADVDVRVGVGRLEVLVPDGVVVDVHPDVRFGAVYVVEDDGTRTQQGRDGRVEQDFTVGGPAGGPVEVDVALQVGEVEVRHVDR